MKIQEETEDPRKIRGSNKKQRTQDKKKHRERSKKKQRDNSRRNRG